MPKLGDNFRDLSPNLTLPEPGQYTFEVSVEDKKSKKGKPMTVLTYKINGGDHDGFEVKDYFVHEKNDGTFNEPSMRGLKKVAIAILGERANQDDFDTEELNGTMCMGILKADEFEDEDTGEAVPSIKMKRVLGPA